jgi:hypothetical protein
MQAGEAALPGGDFRLLVQRMGYQALIGLGVLENPVTGERRPNLPSARAVLADLAMLREKTAGNLDPGEREHLEKVLTDLSQALARAGGG